MSIEYIFVSFSFKTTLFLSLFFLLFSFLNFDFTVYLENINWEVLLLAKLEKLCLPRNLWLQLTPWDGMTMGWPLASLLANVFMCSSEKSIVPTLKDCLVHWKRYVDDTHAYIKPDKRDYVIEKTEHLSPTDSIHLRTWQGSTHFVFRCFDLEIN